MSKKEKDIIQNEEQREEILKNAEQQDVEEPVVEIDDDHEDDAGGDDDVQVVEEPSLEQQLEQQKKEYLFLMADFDNYRKRTLQEKQELIKNGAARAMEELLPVVDDFERALDAIGKSGDLDSLKEGVDLIYNKFIKYLKQQHVEEIKSTGELFDTDLHEAVTTFPAPSEDMKGKVIDTVLKGYTLNNKVIRHAKVVVGQ